MSEREEELIASVVQSVNEWDDRTSPDDYPDHLLITSEELTLILRNFAADLVGTPSQDMTERLEKRLAFYFSHNNQPCMSGDPRDRCSPLQRRNLSEAVKSVLEEITQ